MHSVFEGVDSNKPFPSPVFNLRKIIIKKHTYTLGKLDCTRRTCSAIFYSLLSVVSGSGSRDSLFGRTNSFPVLCSSA